MGIALAIKDALRSGDLYLPQSKHHTSFWDLTLSETDWEAIQTGFDGVLDQPTQEEVKAVLTVNFHTSVTLAQDQFKVDPFAQIQEGRLKLKRYTKVSGVSAANTLQKIINARLPLIRIERLLIEVDKYTQFSHHFTSVSGHQSKPRLFYKTLLAALIAQAINLGLVAMSASVEDVTVDMLRRVLQDYIREETLIAASAEIVNQPSLMTCKKRILALR